MKTRARNLKNYLDESVKLKKEKQVKDGEDDDDDDEEFQAALEMVEAAECDSNDDGDDDNSDDDAPVAVTFEDQTKQRTKTEKAAKTSARITQQRAKEERKKKIATILPLKKAAPKIKQKVEMNEVMQLSEDEDVQSKKSKQGKKGTKPKEEKKESGEFKMADTFDFRQYLPENVLEGSDEEEDDDEIDSEEEELAKAIMEGGYGGESDEGYNGSEEHEGDLHRRKSKKDATKSQNQSDASHPVDMNPKTPNRRGGRRVRKKHSTVPRVVIFNRQNHTSAEAIRERADAFIQKRLFPKEFTSPGPRRMDRATLESLSAKKRARTTSLTLL